MSNHFYFRSALNLPQIAALLTKHHQNLQPCLLHDENTAVLGILPKTSWQVWALQDQNQHHNLNVIKSARNQSGTRHHSNYHDWQRELIDYMQSQSVDQPHDGYHNGLMGFIGYDVAANALNREIRIPTTQPCAYMGHYDIYLKPCDGGFKLWAIDADDDTMQHLKDILNKLLQDAQPVTPKPLNFCPVWKKTHYGQAFEKTQNYIKAGDTYQINLTQCWQADLTDTLSLYIPKLIQTMNAPFAGFLSIDGFELLSVSPELFFEFVEQNNEQLVITKPIKGTRPRSLDLTKDEQLKNELANSQKDISENLMIVDLLRNDLGKYATVGGVKTPQRFFIESFQNVHHMVSTIEAKLKKDIHPLSVLFDSLPAGSITGAPKKRACEIIFELESEPRGAYCGTLGYLNFDGTGKWNVLIRTLQASNQQVQIWAGGGITIMSDVDDEYQECLDKIGRIMQVC